jgi:hypothetical protein
MDDMKRPESEGPPHSDPEPHSRPERPEPVPEVLAEYLRTLSEELGEPNVELESQAHAYRRLRELQHKVGRKPKRILENEQTDG